MEVVEAVSKEEEEEEDRVKGERIQLLTTSNSSGGTRASIDDGGDSSQTTSMFFCNSGGQLVPAEIVVDSLGENIIAVPLGSAVGKKKARVGVRVLEVGGPSNKCNKPTPVFSVRHVRPQPSTVIATTSLLTTAVTVTTTKSVAQTKPRQVVVNSLAKTFLPTDIKLPSKSDSVCTKILITTDAEAKAQEQHTEELDVNPQLSAFQDDQLTVLTDMADKTSQCSGEEGDDGAATVMMRVNSLGDVELDPLFLTADHLALDTHQVGSGNINQSWFTSREDKEMLRWRGHAWRQGMWSREETELLKHNIREYCAQRGLDDPAELIFKMSKEERSGFYRVIARGLNRPLFSVYRRVIRLYDDNNHMGKYTTEEVRKLRELRMKHGNNWQAIAAHLGRSAASVKDRCRLLNEHCNRGAWKPDEEDRLAAAVYELAQVLPGEQVTSGISWSEVAGRVRTRSEKQCRTKWLNYLNWKRTSGVEWSKSDDIQLICRLSVCGVREESQVDWNTLARAWPACRSPHWLRGKWWNLKRRLPQSAQGLILKDMCQQLYNMMSLSLLQSTLVELPATFLNNTAAAGHSQCPTTTTTTTTTTTSTTTTITTTTTPTAITTSLEGKSTRPDSSQECDGLTVGTIKLCIPAANFSHIINTDDGEDDFATRLSGLVQSALLAQNVEGRGTGGSTPTHVLPPSPLTPSTTTTPSHLTQSLTSLSGDAKSSPSIVVATMEDSLSLHLPDVTRELHQGGIGENVKEEDLLSDGETGSSQAAITTALDPNSPSTVILNDPILSVSGEPLGEEGLQTPHHDPHISCSSLTGN